MTAPLDPPPPPLPPAPGFEADPIVERCDRALRDLRGGRTLVPAAEVVDLLLDLRGLARERAGR